MDETTTTNDTISLVKNINEMYNNGELKTLLPLLPSLSIKGKPYNLDDFFPMEPLFKTVTPPEFVYKCGRQVSKCIDPNSPIMKPNGFASPAHRFALNDGVMVNANFFANSNISKIYNSGSKLTYRVVTQSGTELVVTKDHRLFTESGYHKLKDLTTDDALTLLFDYDNFGSNDDEESVDKSLTESVFELTKPALIRYLAVHYDYALGASKYLLMSSKWAAINMRSLLRKFGIHSTVKFDDNMYIIEILTGNYRNLLFDPIVSITEYKVIDTIDFEVNGYHNFLIDGAVVHNSTSMAAHGVIQSIATSFFDTLFVTPRFEQIRRFSSNVVRPFIEHSGMIKSFMHNSKCEASVGQRSFRNNSNMYFASAFLSVDSVRGISSSKLSVDEVQDMDFTFIPVLQECMSAAKAPITQYAGTPKSFDNTLEGLWQRSSQAEWITKCEGCNYWNTPRLDADLIKMIGLNTIVCAKCSKPINPATGHFKHFHPERAVTFAGYHIPQIIMPMHYKDINKWDRVKLKMETYPKAEFLNECLGESCDEGHKLVSLTELQEASVLKHPNEIKAAIATRGRYRDVAIGVDWGGYGLAQTSFTVVSVVGKLVGTDALHVIYMERFSVSMGDDDQALRILAIMNMFRCQILAHDFGGQGQVKETLLLHAGIPIGSITPIAYVRAKTGTIMTHKPITAINPRNYYSVDKARSITLICAYIKKMKIHFPVYESCKDLLQDFLALTAESSQSKAGSDTYFIGRVQNMSDDTVHAVNYACLALWYKYRDFPRLTEVDAIRYTGEDGEESPPDVW